MQVVRDAPLAPLTTLGLGGPARTLVRAEVRDEVGVALSAADEAGERILVLSGGSNVVLPDAGWDGTVVLVDTRGTVRRELGGDRVRLDVEAGEPWDPLVDACVGDGLAGFEWLAGIPGSTGATPVQNVGAYGREVADTLLEVRVWDRRERAERVLDREECRFAYRSSALKGQDRLVVLAVSFVLTRAGLGSPVAYPELARALGIAVGERAPVAAVRDAVLALRRGKGMVLDPADPDSVSAGSFFTNPLLTPAELAEVERRAGAAPPQFPGEDGRLKTSAAWLIERAGFTRGHARGAAAVSHKHTLALTNRGGASTADLLALAREVRDGVREAYGIELRPEPLIVGEEL